ncbi:MAG: 3-dehydroquinate synthase [Actinomycetota bacterium]|nr:3-dehydroquinate synthase [Actinomycetota bacterium]
MRSVKVDLGERSYEVIVGQDLLQSVGEFLPAGDYDKILVIADQAVDALHGQTLAPSLESRGEVHRLAVPSGERSKSWSVAGRLLESLAALRVRRNDVVVSFGGGMVSDLAGFVASVYQRGVAVIHVPTTLLGQVDAAIGGKTGVNLRAGKNLAGTFYQPSLVLSDVLVLDTLPLRELRSGMAEVVKYALCYEPWMIPNIREVSKGVSPRGSDDDLRTWKPTEAGPAGVVEGRQADLLEDLVSRCAGIKASVVSRDELDHSGRIVLNYGHTLGHALEAAGGYRRWLHGEAISVGMVFAARLAERMGLLSSEEADLHADLLAEVGLPVKARFDPDSITRAWDIDKKHLRGQRWVLLEGLGKPVVRSDVDPRLVRESLDSVSTGPGRL